MPFIQRIFGKCFHLHSPLLLSINKTCTFTQPVQEHELCKWKQRLSEKHFFVLKIIDKGKEEMELYTPNISGSIWTEIEEKARIDDQKGDFSFLPFRRWRKDVHSKKFYRLLYWLYSREESRMGVVKADEWRFFLLRNGKEKSTEWKFLYFSSIIILLRHQHTCTYFCWHYVKWWIISWHEGYIFYSLLSKKDGRTTVNWDKGTSMKLDFSSSVSYQRNIHRNKRHFPKLLSHLKMWLNSRKFFTLQQHDIRVILNIINKAEHCHAIYHPSGHK